MSLISLLKGWIGETLGSVAHAVHLDKTVYVQLNNLTLPTSNGTTQVDHVLVSRFGVFVVESKNIDGWIFGDERSAQWTVVKPGRKFRMQNPLHQNYRHVRALAEFLPLEEDKFHSLVEFWGDCTFKTPMPRNVMQKGMASYIQSFTQVLLSDDDVAHVVQRLRDGTLPKTWATRRAHVQSLKQRYASTTTCPKCANPLALRTATRGAHKGSRFYGCTAFPRCRYTAPADGPG